MLHRTRPVVVPTIIAAAAALLFAGCGSDSDDSPGDDKGSTARTSPATLSVCTSVPFEPAEYEEDGTLVGYDIDVMNAIGEQLKRDVTFQTVDFDTILDALDKGTCDAAISSMAITPEREAKATFVPYLSGTKEDPSKPEGPDREVPDPDAPPLGIAVRSDDDALRVDIEQAVAAMYEDGKMRALLEQWDATSFLLDPAPAAGASDSEAA